VAWSVDDLEEEKNVSKRCGIPRDQHTVT
jgi:hypothetical protein